MWSDSLLIVFISICTAFLGEGKKCYTFTVCYLPVHSLALHVPTFEIIDLCYLV